VRKIKIAFIQKIPEDNIGILQISSVLINHGFSTRVWIEGRKTYNEVKSFSADIIGYPCYTGDQKWIFSSIKKLKAAGIDAKVIVGGPHATFFPELIHNESIDVICRGEGEYALLDYAIALEENKDPYGIKNLYFNINGEIIENELRPLVTDLNTLPFPDRSYYNRYRFLARNPYKIFITGRGCPFKCTFCFNHALHELYGKTAKYIRRRSAINVIEEVQEVKHRWGIDEIRFSDDHFALSTQWLKEFASSYKKDIDRPYTINTRVDVLDEEKISYLKDSGCRLVCFGIETGREDIRNNVLKKSIKDEQIFKAAELLKKYKIKFLTSNIIGLPNETSKDAWQTIEMNQRIGTNLPWFSMMQYYPGTQIFKEAQEAGLIAGNFNGDELGSYFKNDYLQQNNIDELKNIHSFSIITSRYKFFEPLAKLLSKKCKPNFLFRYIFLFSYLILTIKRANFKMMRLLWGVKYYLNKLST
jgi:anaerobic magnesium-protoporphyrin IX monomethyl ester cyclase